MDRSTEEDGDGSSDKPYNKISKATEEGCGEIKVSSGSYKESISLGESVKLKGSGKDKVTIEGKITMKDNSEVAKLSVVGIGGILVEKGSSVYINDVEINNAITGVETLGEGKLKLRDSVIKSNGKGIYVQKGVKIEIVNCKIYGNKEEGLDIRANVSGSIIGNEIYNNEESGIELILGKSEIIISDNVIKKNSASGIAFQYYSDFDSMGDVRVKDNYITENSAYGINCKAPSGGSGKPKGYWSDSVKLSANKITDNKEKDFASACKFDDDKKIDASKTDEEKEAELRAIEEKKKEELSLEEEKRMEELRKEREERELEIKRQEEIKNQINSLYYEVENIYNEDNALKEKVSSRNRFWSYIIGQDFKSIKNISEHLSVYDEKSRLIGEKVSEITSAEESIVASEKIRLIEEKKDSLRSFIDEENKKFSLLGWIFKKYAYKN